MSQQLQLEPHEAELEREAYMGFDPLYATPLEHSLYNAWTNALEELQALRPFAQSLEIFEAPDALDDALSVATACDDYLSTRSADDIENLGQLFAEFNITGISGDEIQAVREALHLRERFKEHGVDADDAGELLEMLVLRHATTPERLRNTLDAVATLAEHDITEPYKLRDTLATLDVLKRHDLTTPERLRNTLASLDALGRIDKPTLGLIEP